MKPHSANGRFDVVVVGGGIVGLATAWQLLRLRRALRLALLEKEPTLGAHQTGHNSGVMHAGLHYRPGSNKARLSVSGLRQLVRFCQEYGVACEQCGKIVVATHASEVPRLDALIERGRANGLQGLERLNRDQIHEIEPEVAGVAAVRVPEEGIVDFPAVAEQLGDLIRRAGGEICLHSACGALHRTPTEWRVQTRDREFRAGYVVTCGGLHSDRLVRLSGQRPRVRIVPFRGEYFALRKERVGLVRHLVYPVPDPGFPFLGPHFTRRINGGVEVGPNAVLAFAREGYRWTDVSWRDLVGSILFPGLWRFLVRHPTLCGYEVWRSLSKREFCRSLQRMVPALAVSDLATGGAGVRAQAMTPDGRLADDFSFEEGDHILHVVNAPSPAATAALAIGGELAGRVCKRLP